MNNPNKANQYKPDPRQTLFLSNYLNPNSKTFSNALQSAISAGYSQEYSENITKEMPTWLSENLGNNKMLEKAVKNLDELLDEKRDKKLRLDVSKFVAERIGKKDWSIRSELTGKDGKDLVPSPMLGGQTKDAVPTNDSNKETS